MPSGASVCESAFQETVRLHHTTSTVVVAYLKISLSTNMDMLNDTLEETCSLIPVAGISSLCPPPDTPQIDGGMRFALQRGSGSKATLGGVIFDVAGWKGMSAFHVACVGLQLLIIVACPDESSSKGTAVLLTLKMKGNGFGLPVMLLFCLVTSFIVSFPSGCSSMQKRKQQK